MFQLTLCLFLILDWGREAMCQSDMEPDFSLLEDTGVRNVTQQLHYYCPNTSLCKYPLSFGRGTGNPPSGSMRDMVEGPCCARNCLCGNEGPTCQSHHSCCPDMLDALVSREEVRKIMTNISVCTLAQYREFNPEKSNSLSFSMTVVCQTNFAESQTQHLCDLDYSEIDFTSDTIMEFVPVSVNTSGTMITYKNRHCAICNGVTKDLLLWDIAVECERGFVFIETFGDIPNALASHPECNIVFKAPSEVAYRIPPCEISIDRCNVTGLWRRYDPFLEAACLSYTVRYNDAFKNIHCYLCNGYNVSNINYKCDSPFLGNSFMALLDFQGLGNPKDTETDGSGDCSRNQVYDPMQKTCLDLECSQMMKLNENRSKCVPSYTYVNKLNLQMSFALAPTKTNTSIDSYTLLSSVVKDRIDDYLTNQTRTGLLPIYVCNVETFLKVNKPFSDVTHANLSLDSSDVRYIGVRVKLGTTYIYDMSVHEVIEEMIPLFLSSVRLPSMTTLNHDIAPELFDNTTEMAIEHSFSAPTETFASNNVANSSILDRLLPATNSLQDPSDGLTILPLPYIIERREECEDTPATITPLQFCPKIKLTDDHFSVDMNNLVLNISVLNLRVDLNQVLFSSNWKTVHLCKETYLTALSEHWDATPDTREIVSTAQDIVSTICLCLSLTCLVATETTYIVYRSLRTLPGMNNMALVTWLFITQLLFLIDSLVEIGPPWLCKAFGVFIHFSLLSAFFWMNICTFHMTRVFLTLESQTATAKGTHFSTFIKYIVVAAVFPVMFVAVNLTVSLVGSDMSDIGYGGQPCYITRKEMIGYTVAIPLGFVIISDFIMFFVVIYKLKRMPDMHKHTKHERNNVVIFAKLSTITGLTWVFAFIYQWSHVTAFAYLFIVLNASQGVFIMFAFVVNKRVLAMIRGTTYTATENTHSSTLAKTKTFVQTKL